VVHNEGVPFVRNRLSQLETLSGKAVQDVIGVFRG
jgi:hypothetical protein